MKKKNNIEVEIRSFISEEQYSFLLEFFKKNADYLKEDFQETYYFTGKDDLRIQRNNYYSKIWMKSGKIHDDARKELEIQFDKNDFDKLESLFILLGYKVKIKWFRKRNVFKWGKITVCLDYTKGYGYIIELEQLTSEKDKEEAITYLKRKLKELKIEQTKREEFEKKFAYYEKNWRRLIK